MTPKIYDDSYLKNINFSSNVLEEKCFDPLGIKRNIRNEEYHFCISNEHFDYYYATPNFKFSDIYQYVLGLGIYPEKTGWMGYSDSPTLYLINCSFRDQWRKDNMFIPEFMKRIKLNDENMNRILNLTTCKPKPKKEG